MILVFEGHFGDILVQKLSLMSFQILSFFVEVLNQSVFVGKCRVFIVKMSEKGGLEAVSKAASMGRNVDVMSSQIIMHLVFSLGPWLFAGKLKQKGWLLSLSAYN